MKGKIVWLLGFMCFLAGISVINSAILLTLNGGDLFSTFSISSLGLTNVNVMMSLLVSVVATFLLLGSTVYFVFKGLPADPDILHRLGRLESSLTANSSMLENTQMGFFRRLEKSEEIADNAFRKMHIDIEAAKKQMNDSLEKQNQVLQGVQIESNKNADVVRRQASDLKIVGKRVETIEKAVAPSPKTAKLNSDSKLEDVPGVNHNLEKELKNLGVTTVGQFLTMEPLAIAEKTLERPEAVTNMQAKAQLLMVPSLTPSDAELLVKIGVTSRKELADQDPVHLCRSLVSLANIYVEKGKMASSRVPTIDEVWSWIKLAHP